MIKKTLTLALAALAAAAGSAAAGCLTSSAQWRNTAMASQSAAFTAAFDLTPNNAKMDGVVGVSASGATSFNSLAAIVRLNSAGYIDVRNGSSYNAAYGQPYSAGQTFHVRMVVDPSVHKYSVYVTPPGQSERTLASGYAFRTEQAGVTSLASWALYSDAGTETVCSFSAAAPSPSGSTGSTTGGTTTTTGGTTTTACMSSAGSWQNTAMAAQTAPFTAAYDVTPGANGIDGVTGLSNGPATGFTSLAAIVRFNSAGYVDARNGGSYTAAAKIPYSGGGAYHVRLAVDPTKHVYSAYVTPPGGSEQTIGVNYAFRTEQAATSSLSSWAALADLGSEKACSLGVTAAPGVDGVPPTVAVTAPLSGATVSGAGVALTASASDNVGVAGVQFQLDGANLGAELTQAPFSMSWDASTTANGSHTLTAVARDAAGNKATSTPVAITVMNPIVAGGFDKWGVKELYPTMSGGKEWFSTWDDGVARSFSSNVDDPQDPWFHTKYLGDATYSVDGKGLFKISGQTPRMYIWNPSKVDEWHNVEMTVYAMRVSDSSTPWGGIEGVARTNHTNDTSNYCDTRGNDARFRYDGHIDFEKETHHPYSVAVQNKSYFSGGLPYNKWIGYKLVVYDLPNGDVKLESWMDLSDGLNGGNWVKVNELEDTGKNFGVGGTPCAPGIDPALRLTNSDNRPGTETGYPNYDVYWRSDGVGTNGLIYKKMSVREVLPGGATTASL